MDSAPWGGSEELWSRAALDLVAEGFPVSASVVGWSPLHSRVLDLRARGVELWLRPRWHCVPLWQHPWRRLMSRLNGPTAFEVARLIATRHPALTVLSVGGPFPPIDLLELCVSKGSPFVSIAQTNAEGFWPSDDLAERYRLALAGAVRCFFVSRANLQLAEKQIGASLPNAEVVRNPFNISFDATPPWPAMGCGGEMCFACVARLTPSSKGQDILLEALATPLWQDRSWRLYLYGEGPQRQGLERFAETLGLADRVVFAGFAAVEKIWAANHVLIMPSRFEGLPLAMVEAMLCARPVIATNVAGHAEIIEDGVTGFLADAPTVGALSIALERFWERRTEAEEIGRAGAKKIRQLIPNNPVRVFADKLKTLTSTVACPNCAPNTPPTPRGTTRSMLRHSLPGPRPFLRLRATAQAIGIIQRR
jgi:glycosyltransferase involved in cell wall biosynthesis